MLHFLHRVYKGLSPKYDGPIGSEDGNKKKLSSLKTSTSCTRKRKHLDANDSDNCTQEKTFRYPLLEENKLIAEVKNFVEPTNKDVVFGKPGNHPGNKVYRDEVEILKPVCSVWMGTDEKNITELAQLLVDTVRQKTGGRFLQQDENGKHFEVTNEAARRHASRALREPNNTPESRQAKRAKHEKKLESTGVLAERISQRVAPFEELSLPKDSCISSDPADDTVGVLEPMLWHNFEDRWTHDDRSVLLGLFEDAAFDGNGQENREPLK